MRIKVDHANQGKWVVSSDFEYWEDEPFFETKEHALEYAKKNGACYVGQIKSLLLPVPDLERMIEDWADTELCEDEYMTEFGYDKFDVKDMRIVEAQNALIDCFDKYYKSAYKQHFCVDKVKEVKKELGGCDE